MIAQWFCILCILFEPNCSSFVQLANHYYHRHVNRLHITATMMSCNRTLEHPVSLNTQVLHRLSKKDDTLDMDVWMKNNAEESHLRRSVLSRLLSYSLLFSVPSFWKSSIPAAYAASTIPTSSSSPILSQQFNYGSAKDAKITHRVFFNVRISRADGTFYVRDDETNASEDNQVYYGQLSVALFGQNAPNHVQQFLQYVIGPSTVDASTSTSKTVQEDNETPFPSYSRSSFTQYEDATGVLYGGTIPSLDVVEIQNSVALQYGNRLLPAKLWVEDGSSSSGQIKISHDSIGLLTHRQLDLTPTFGITTRADTTQLNPTHTVFGQVIMNPSAEEFLRRVTKLPTYSVNGPVVSPSFMLSTSSSSPQEFGNDKEPNSVVSFSKAALYKTQREFFRNTAKTFGDSRVNKLYDGKILRRVEVTQVGLLKS